MRVVIAPDSFKGTCTAQDAARAVATGWRRRRPHDDVVLVPLADGGEGTLDALGTLHGTQRRSARVTGPDGRPVTADWLLRPSGEAIIELAQAAGLPLMERLDPLHATTLGVGELIREALDAHATSITVALGGSATTDGGFGALAALGLRLLDAAGLPLPAGGAALRRLAWIDDHDLLTPPMGGVRLLSDVTNPLLGPAGAAAVFGPQKGADVHQVHDLDEALHTLAEVLGADPMTPGMGAAGGAAYGLVAAWGATLIPGAETIARLCGLPEALEGADVVITGEGRFDDTSLGGKVVGHVLQTVGDEVIIIAGSLATRPPGRALSLVELAGSAAAALRDTQHWLARAGAAAADAVEAS